MAQLLLKRITIVLLLAVLNTGCTYVIFQPHKKHYIDPAEHGVVFDDVFLKSSDNIDLHGWWLPHHDSDYKATILFLHGNAGNISTHIGNAYWLTRHGYNVFLFDYRGYGYSEGYPELPGIMQDISSALEYAYERNNRQKVIVIGQSLGASLGIYAIPQPENRNKVQAYIDVSGFSDYHDITQDVLSGWWLTWAFQWPLSFTVNNDYSPMKTVANISPIPFAVLHSPDDEIIPYHHGAELFETAQPPKELIQLQGLHNLTFASEHNRSLVLIYLETVINQ